MNTTSRRNFLKTTAAGAAYALTHRSLGAAAAHREYKISLAGWSLHRTIGEGDGKTPMLEFPRMTREFGIDGLEVVNRMLASTEPKYLDQFAKNCADQNVTNLLIMVDGEGAIGADDEAARQDAVDRHKKWVDIASDWGCHSIRMNWGGAPKEAPQDAAALQAFVDRSVSPFRALCDYADSKNINVIIENHGGPSSYPDAMEKLMAAVDHERFGTLPDFGNFPADVEIYDAIDRLMPFAKAVSAKCYDFGPHGYETKLDYPRLISLVHDKHGYNGFIGIEYEGNRLSEPEGIQACKALLEKLRDEEAPEA